MTPQKKATPALKDLLDKKDESAPELDADETAIDPDKEDLSTVSLVDPHKDHVHTWEEDHDQNLARLQKDVVVSSAPSEQPTVTSTVTETVYAEEAEVDDTGRSKNNYSDSESDTDGVHNDSDSAPGDSNSVNKDEK